MKISDNANKPVYYWQKFLPEGYDLAEINKDKSHLMKEEDLEQKYIFHRKEDQRILILDIYKKSINIECFYADPFPHGVYQHIDWNDSTFLELLPYKNGINVLQICSIIVQKGYKYHKHIIY